MKARAVPNGPIVALFVAAALVLAARDAACEVFGTVLSPDYNAAHADHLHFDQAARGFGGLWR